VIFFHAHFLHWYLQQTFFSILTSSSFLLCYSVLIPCIITSKICQHYLTFSTYSFWLISLSHPLWFVCSYRRLTPATLFLFCIHAWKYPLSWCHLLNPVVIATAFDSFLFLVSPVSCLLLGSSRCARQLTVYFTQQIAVGSSLVRHHKLLASCCSVHCTSRLYPPAFLSYRVFIVKKRKYLRKKLLLWVIFRVKVKSIEDLSFKWTIFVVLNVWFGS